MKRISSRFLLTAFLFSLVKITAAQTEETISADRPDQTEATYILPKNNFQLSDGFLIARETFQNDLTLRYGLFKHTEIRTSLSFGSYPDKFQLQPVQLTLKRKLSEGEKSLPSISLIATAELEMLASKDLKSDKIPVQVIFAFEHDIQKKYFVGYNLGTSSWFKDLYLTLETGGEINNKISFFLEYYGQYTKGLKPDHNMDYGILYLINPSSNRYCCRQITRE